MRIRFSRHAKRRARLYGISESIIADILTDTSLHQGEQEIIRNVEGFKFPLKIVVFVKEDLATVITNYPLKKGRKR